MAPDYIYIYSGVKMLLEMNPESINFQRMEDGCVPLHIAAVSDRCDILCFLASVVLHPYNRDPLLISTVDIHIMTKTAR